MMTGVVSGYSSLTEIPGKLVWLHIPAEPPVRSPYTPLPPPNLVLVLAPVHSFSVVSLYNQSPPDWREHESVVFLTGWLSFVLSL